MSAFARVGTFTSRNGTGSQAVTGLGFTVKGLWIFCEVGGLGFNDSVYSMVGWSDGTTSHAFHSTSLDNQTTSDQNRVFSSSTIINGRSNADGAEFVASLTSLDSDGFTLNWTTNAVGSLEFIFVAFGGSSVNCKVGLSNINTTTGNQGITGAGFTPTAVCGVPVFPSGETVDARTFPAIGFTDGTRRACNYVVSEDAQNPADTWGYQRTDKFVAWGVRTDGTVEAEADIVSLDADGFTINVTTASASTERLSWFAINGMAAYVGTFTNPSSPGDQTESAPGFPPGVVLFSGFGRAAASTPQSEARWNLGAASPHQDLFVSERGIVNHDVDNVSPTRPSRLQSHWPVLAITGAATGTSSTIDAGAFVERFTTTGFVLRFHHADATAREWFYLALEASEADIRETHLPHDVWSSSGAVRETHLPHDVWSGGSAGDIRETHLPHDVWSKGSGGAVRETHLPHDVWSKGSGGAIRESHLQIVVWSVSGTGGQSNAGRTAFVGPMLGPTFTG